MVQDGRAHPDVVRDGRNNKRINSSSSLLRLVTLLKRSLGHKSRLQHYPQHLTVSVDVERQMPSRELFHYRPASLQYSRRQRSDVHILRVAHVLRAVHILWAVVLRLHLRLRLSHGRSSARA